jgi:hypothetical protein
VCASTDGHVGVRVSVELEIVGPIFWVYFLVKADHNKYPMVYSQHTFLQSDYNQTSLYNESSATPAKSEQTSQEVN